MMELTLNAASDELKSDQNNLTIRMTLESFLKLEKDFGLADWADPISAHASLVAKTGYKMPVLYSLKKAIESLKKVLINR